MNIVHLPKTLIVPSFMILKSSSRSKVSKRNAVKVISLSGSLFPSICVNQQVVVEWVWIAHVTS
jgi:hypothetical protein